MTRFAPILTAAFLGLCASAAPAFGQATTRPCGSDETPGPACLMARQTLPNLPRKVFWHLDQFADEAAAEAAAARTSTVVEAFGQTWLFTIEGKKWRSHGGTRVATVGPLPVEPAPTYTAEYLRSVFMPGMTAPLHVHSGPEAFYAISGDTCLETPDGVRQATGLGNSLVIRGGPPMLLMAVGDTPRRGFALILHDSTKPPTTLIHDWHPHGRCQVHMAGE